MKSQAPIRLKDFSERSKYNFLRDYDEFSTIIIPFRISLKDSFKQNLYSSLDRISSSKQFSYGGSFKRGSLTNTSQDINIGISDDQSGERIVYSFKGLTPLLRAQKDWHALKYYSEYCPLSCPDGKLMKPFYNPLTVKVVGSNNQNISSISLSEYKETSSSWKEINVRCVAQSKYNGTDTRPCEVLAFSLYNKGGKESVIYTSKEFFLVLNMDIEKLSNVKEVRIGYGQL